jgi:hypothetical protein
VEEDEGREEETTLDWARPASSEVEASGIEEESEREGAEGMDAEVVKVLTTVVVDPEG